jgi:hypothetical protein
VDDWKTQNNFKTIEKMKAELEKIFTDGKLDETFKTAMTKADAEINSVADLLTKKKASEIITLIRKWEYDKDSETNKQKTVKIIKINMSKKPTDTDPTAEEITTGLYKLAVGDFKNKTEAEITA